MHGRRAQRTQAQAQGADVLDGGGGSTNPIFNSVRVTGSCGLIAGNVGQCGFTFGDGCAPSDTKTNLFGGVKIKNDRPKVRA